MNNMSLRGDEMLGAQHHRLTAETRTSAPLPPTQWQAEVVNMANIMLAALQRRIVDYASPPNMSVPTLNGSSSSLAYVTPPDDEGEQLCQKIRIRDASHFNFSVAGLLAHPGPRQRHHRNRPVLSSRHAVLGSETC